VPLEMLGKYERLDVLGHGASGIVYLAKDTLLGKQVALKEISAQGDEKHRFLEEARVLDRLRHPNIVQVNSVDEIGGKVVIDMEYVRGRNLQDILRDTPQLPIPQALDIAAQISDGLAYAHSRRTVHRDIKPANILLTREGVVKLVDFGLAEVLGTHSFAGGAGTYAYMAPEDFHPEEHSDRQSDIWAVGVILYEMLAGRRPFQVAKSKDPFAWKLAVENDPLVPLRDLCPEVPPALEAIVAHALSRDKAARYHEAGVMAADLRGLIATPPAPAHRASAAGTVGGVARNEPGWVPPAVLPGFPPDLPDIDTYLSLAPDRWDAARDGLIVGALARWLASVGEAPLAAVAEEVAGEMGRDEDDKLRDFLYRAGMETAAEARRAFAEGQRLARGGRYFFEAIPLLRRAVHLDPSRPEYPQELASALRATGDAAAAALVLEEALAYHPAERKLVREHAELAGAQVTLSDSHVDFGVLRRGQSRTCKLTLRNEGGGILEGRVAAAPGWVKVEPPSFSTRKRQTLTLTASTEGVWSTPTAYQENVVLETSGGRQELAVSVSILPARLSWTQIVLWYLPLLICAAFPAATGLFAQLHQGGLGHLWQPGFTASGLLYLSVFLLAFAAEVAWPPRLLALGLSVLNFWCLSRTFQNFGGSNAAAHLALIQTVTPIIVLLTLQTCAFFLDAPGWGRWQLWRWIIGATGLLIGYSLLHLG
jgi:predicted Ser/Thr protein kinase/tetratricopeptide (TPR) repeat protein